MAVMCEFAVIMRLLTSVCMKAMFIIFWFILVLKFVKIFSAVMCELMVLGCWVFMSVRLAIAVMCAVVVRPIASIEFDKAIIPVVVPNVDKSFNVGSVSMVAPKLAIAVMCDVVVELNETIEVGKVLILVVVPNVVKVVKMVGSV